MEQVSPIKIPHSQDTSPWQNSTSTGTGHDNGPRRMVNPVTSLLSHYSLRRRARFAVCALLVLGLITWVLHLEKFRHVYDNERLDFEQSTHAAPTHYAPQTINAKPSERKKMDWSKHAYATYATDDIYLCNALMMFARLHELGTSAKKVLIYPESWSMADESHVGRMLSQAQREYGVVLHPVAMLLGKGQDATWQYSYTKLHVFNLTAFEKVLYLDNDGMILQLVDDLFEVPLLDSSIAMPRAYWEIQPKYNAQLMLLRPSRDSFSQVMSLYDKNEKDQYDMDIINTVFGPSCMVLPHRPYNLLSGEFSRAEDDHARYLGMPTTTSDFTVYWDADQELRRARVVHFSDWPFPKPWTSMSKLRMENEAPKCRERRSLGSGAGEDCADRMAWLWLREEFGRRRAKVCGLDEGTKV